MPLLDERQSAYVLALNCYRNVECWENYHAKGAQLNMNIYDEMLVAVKREYDYFRPLYLYLRMDSAQLRSALNCLTEAEQRELLFLFKMGRNNKCWDKAQRVSDPIGDDNIQFLLSGRLKSACENRECLDDKLMKEINIDVHNRMYTLIVKHRI